MSTQTTPGRDPTARHNATPAVEQVSESRSPTSEHTTAPGTGRHSTFNEDGSPEPARGSTPPIGHSEIHDVTATSRL
ncbi:hypothetical protein [Streptacidiphilus rugosus]|uniref:hypothetical protein n=1 Tax=Streptacidiphilus rugosus TaxID=405783 RepID=UPI001E39946B|nr:hypothetical protein [Streptacidiphilus rugosus]